MTYFTGTDNGPNDIPSIQKQRTGDAARDKKVGEVMDIHQQILLEQPQPVGSRTGVVFYADRSAVTSHGCHVSPHRLVTPAVAGQSVEPSLRAVHDARHTKSDSCDII